MSNNSLKPLIGITGGIGSGKSLICRIFSCLGIPIFNTDEEAKKIIHQDVQVKKAIIELLGPEAFDANGVYQNTFVRTKILQNPNLRQGLNQIVHPAVRAKAFEFQKNLKEKIPFGIYESALLNQQNKPEFISKIILVQSDKNSKIERLKERNLTMEEIEKMMIIQDGSNLGFDYFINNKSGDKILPQVLNLYLQILES